MTPFRSGFILTLFALWLLAGCGHRGGLYIEGDAPDPKPSSQETSHGS